LSGQSAFAQIADLSISKAGPASAFNGDTVTYTLTVSNIGPNGANGASFIDNLPAGLTNISATCTAAIGGATCPATITVGATSVSGVIPTLPANGVLTILITARFPVGGTDTSLTNNGSVTAPAGVTDPVPSSNSTFINTALTYRTADLQITKTASTTSYTLGTPIDYTVTLANLGPGPADGAVFRDRLSAQLFGAGSGGAIVSTINSVSCTAAGGASCPTFTSPATVTTQGDARANIAIPLLPAGGSVQFVMRITPTGYSAGTCGFTSINLINTGSIQGMPASVVDPVGGNNSQGQTAAGPTGVIPPCASADIGTTKISTPATTPTFGQPVTYTIVYFNNGPGSADGTRIIDQLNLQTAGTGLQAQLGYNSASVVSCVSTPGTTCPILTAPASGTVTTANSTVFSQLVNTWPSGGRLTITYTLTPQNFGPNTCGFTTYSLRNVTSRTMPAGITDPGPSADSATASNALPDRPPCPVTDIATSKTLISGQMGLGQTLTYRVTISNIGASTATNVTFSDSIFHGFGTGLGSPFLSINNTAVGACSASGAAVCPVLPSLPPTLALSNGLSTLIPSTSIPSLGPSSSISFTVSFVQSAMNATCARTNATLQNQIALAAPTDYIDSLATNNVATAVTNFSCADVATNKTVTPTTAAAGATVTFTFAVTNAGPATLTNVPFSDPLPAGFTYLSSSCATVSGGATCAPPVFTPSPASVDGTITLMPPNSAVRYSIVGLAANLPGSWSNRGSVGIPLPGIFDPDLASNASAVSFNVTSDLPSVSKLTTRANSVPGGTTGYTIVMSNPATGLNVTNVRLTDFLPSGWTYVSTTLVTLNGGATRPVVVTPNLGDTTPTWGTFVLGTNTSVLISFVASIPSAQTCGQVVSNNVTATYTRGGGTQTSAYLGQDPGLTSDDVTIQCPQVGAAKALTSQTDNGDGSFSLQYSLRFRNDGNELLNPVQFRDALATAQGGSLGNFTASNPPAPGEYRIALAPAFFGSCAGMTLAGGYNGSTQLILATGSLAAGLECEVRMTVQISPTPSIGTYTNQSVITATGSLSGAPVSDLSDDGSNAVPSSNNGTATTNDPTPATISTTVNLSITKTNFVGSLAAGQTIAYTIIVENAGPSGMLQSVLRDTTSPGLVCTGATCSIASGVGVCPVVGAGAGQLSIANLSGAGVVIPRINTGTQMQFVVTCGVTATGLP
jgi:uncharacterized repeat protein (TIGR01451 family)